MNDSLTLIGFDQKAEWCIMQEDKAVNAFNDDVFPGSSVFLKLFLIHFNLKKLLF